MNKPLSSTVQATVKERDRRKASFSFYRLFHKDKKDDKLKTDLRRSVVELEYPNSPQEKLNYDPSSQSFIEMNMPVEGESASPQKAKLRNSISMVDLSQNTTASSWDSKEILPQDTDKSINHDKLDLDSSRFEPDSARSYQSLTPSTIELINVGISSPKSTSTKSTDRKNSIAERTLKSKLSPLHRNKLRRYCFETQPSVEELPKAYESASVVKLVELFTLHDEFYKSSLLKKHTSQYILEKSKLSTKKKNASDAFAKNLNVYDDLVEDFLTTYTFFTTPAELLELFLVRYKGPDEQDDERVRITFMSHKYDVQRRVLSFMEIWVKLRRYDFESDPHLVRSVTKFFWDYAAEDLEPYIKLFTSKVLSDEKPDFDHPLIIRTNPDDLGRQITLIEHAMFRKIRQDEFLHQRWDKDPSQAPGLCSVFSWFNKMSHWFSTEILREESVENRKTVIVNIIRLATQCQSLANFNAVMEVLSCLHSHPISSLKQTWELVPSSSMQQLNHLGKLMASKSNHQNYRATLADTHPPFVPFLAVYLRDLIYLDDCKPDTINGLINIDKVRSLGKMIRDLMKLGDRDYDITPQPSLQERILNAAVWQENDIYRISKLRESSLQSDAHLSTKYSKYYNKFDVMGREKVSTSSNELTKRDLSLMLASGYSASYKPQDVLIEAGSESPYLWFIKSGTVQIRFIKSKAAIQPYNIKEDSIFGELSILKMVPTSPITAVALDNVEVIKIEISALEILFESDAEISKHFYGTLAVNLAGRLRGQVSEKPAPKQLVLPLRSSQPTSNTSINLNVLLSTSDGPESAGKASGNRSRRSQFDQRIENVFNKEELILKEYPCDLVVSKKITGTMVVLQSSIDFYPRVSHGNPIRMETLPYTTINEFKRSSSTRIAIITNLKTSIYKFKPELRDDAWEMLRSVWRQVLQRESSRTQNFNSYNSQELPTVRKATLRVDESYRDPLSEQDWDSMLKGAKTVKFSKGSVVIEQGQQFQRLYYILKGSCRLERDSNVVNRIFSGEMFGEISFLELDDNGGATVSVIADEDDMELSIIEGYFVRILFDLRPGFAGRFFNYLCCVLASRVTNS